MATVYVKRKSLLSEVSEGGSAIIMGVILLILFSLFLVWFLYIPLTIFVLLKIKNHKKDFSILTENQDKLNRMNFYFKTILILSISIFIFQIGFFLCFNINFGDLFSIVSYKLFTTNNFTLFDKKKLTDIMMLVNIITSILIYFRYYQFKKEFESYFDNTAILNVKLTEYSQKFEGFIQSIKAQNGRNEKFEQLADEEIKHYSKIILDSLNLNNQQTEKLSKFLLYYFDNLKHNI